jgi:hypothetical protein
MRMTVTKEKVNNPEHYQSDKIEAIDVIESFQLNFNLGNVIKYVLRAGKKDLRIIDLKKAAWYLEREIKSSGSDNSFKDNKPLC